MAETTIASLSAVQVETLRKLVDEFVLIEQLISPNPLAGIYITTTPENELVFTRITTGERKRFIIIRENGDLALVIFLRMIHYDSNKVDYQKLVLDFLS